MNLSYIVLVLLLLPGISVAQQPTRDQVDNRLLPTGRQLDPAGQSLTFHGRPVDLAISNDGKLLFAKDRSHLRIIDIGTFELLQSLKTPEGASLYGLIVDSKDNVYFTDCKNSLHIFEPVQEKQPYKLQHSIALDADSFPCGLVLSADEKTAFVCLSKKNSVAVVDLENRTVTRQIPVGVAPFAIAISGNHLFVSNSGGRRATSNDQSAPSAGTPTVIDQRGIASTGSVSVIATDLDLQVINEIPVGRQPSVLLGHRNQIVLCNTNDDSISLLDSSRVLQTIDTRPETRLPFGSMPNALLTVNDKLLVALAGNNAIAVYNNNQTRVNQIGLVPTGWYPAAMVADDKYLFVANIKGEGGRAEKRPETEGRNSHDHLGSIQRIELAKLDDTAQLETWTDSVKKNGRIAQILRANSSQDLNPNIKPVPIPGKLGHPSVFKHVIYVIKENRTFDQIFGDIQEARSMPALCVFPEDVTPNHHKLARRFGVLDNYYCNGVLSADGHSWATEANVTPYLERAFGGFARSYTFGDDPITYSSSGFIWDRFLDAGLSFRNYGEMDYAEPPDGMQYQAIYQAFCEGKPIQFTQNIGIERLRKFSCRDYPGWNMQIPDVLRMDRFLREFREFEQNDGLPNLCIVYLPQDHFGGGITNRSHMADNDLALGRLVQAVSNSKYWKDTVIFVNEDDPQNGFDHIDGHRSICLVISAYSKSGINHQFANQTAVVRTILHIFGLPPLNQQDASAPLMSSCFREQPDFTPYELEPANFPLNELPPPNEEQSAAERRWRAFVAALPLKRTGMKTAQDEDLLNRFIWHEAKGWETPYPQQWVGAHGSGLQALGLKFDDDQDD